MFTCKNEALTAIRSYALIWTATDCRYKLQTDLCMCLFLKPWKAGSSVSVWTQTLPVSVAIYITCTCFSSFLILISFCVFVWRLTSSLSSWGRSKMRSVRLYYATLVSNSFYYRDTTVFDFVKSLISIQHLLTDVYIVSVNFLWIFTLLLRQLQVLVSFGEWWTWDHWILLPLLQNVNSSSSCLFRQFAGLLFRRLAKYSLNCLSTKTIQEQTPKGCSGHCKDTHTVCCCLNGFLWFSGCRTFSTKLKRFGFWTVVQT